VNNSRYNKFKLLLDNGASVSIKDEYGATPLDIACERGNVEAAGELLIKGVKCSQGNIWPEVKDGVKLETLKAARNRLKQITRFQESWFQESLVTLLSQSFLRSSSGSRM
jgi:ankyrin repeat protein